VRACIVNNKAGVLENEKSVLEIFEDYIEKALSRHEKISFYVAVGFFFFEGFQRLYPKLKKLDEKGLLGEFQLIMGRETKKTTKEVLKALRQDASYLTDETFEFIKRLYNQRKFDFRIFLERGFHIKLYLFRLERSGLDVWAGSANLTKAGLEGNIELIVPTGATIDEKEIFLEFFNKLWERSTDDVEELKVIDVIESAAKSKFIYLEPREFFANLIKLWEKEYLVKNISADLSYLAEFQNMSYYLVLEKLKNYGGCILANSVGLGKTDVACMVARYYRELDKRVLIIVPPQIKENWKKTLKKVGLSVKDKNIELISMGLLQKSEFNYEQYRNFDLIIVDESHNFRNPGSNRRQNLDNIIKVNSTAHILLITATPINVSILDFISLLKLFLNTTYKNKLESEGITHKMKRIEVNVNNGIINKEIIGELNYLIQKFSVRIDWVDVLNHFQEDLMKIAGVESFKKPEIHQIEYHYDRDIKKNIFDNVVPFLLKLNYEYTKLWEKEYKEDKNLIWWYKWRLYKRLESSIIAFKRSLEHMLERNEFLLRNLRILTVNSSVDIFSDAGDLFEEERLLNIKNTFVSLPLELQQKVIKNIAEDIETIKWMLERVNKISGLEKKDKKLQELVRILEQENKPTIIFSESADTVEYITKHLKRLNKFSLEMVHGKLKINKELVQERFNKGLVDILVTTDVLSEGVNLPRADVVINFDLPYNPVRLIQRSGRAIRITNPKEIRIYNFLPAREIDKELELCQRVEQRVETIAASIGLDFMIWSIEEGKIEEINESNRSRILNLIREYKEILASRSPDEIISKIPPTLSPEDTALREFVKYYSISEETIENYAKKYSKPIYTSLNGKEKGYFILFEYKGGMYTIGKLYFSPDAFKKEMTSAMIQQIEKIVNKKAEDLDRGFTKISYREDKLTLKIERLIDEIDDKEVYELFENVDILLFTRKQKDKIINLLNKMKSAPPWKRKTKKEKLKEIIRDIGPVKQITLGRPRILAVIVYE